jgi:AcrR family transcriptional regulator
MEEVNQAGVSKMASKASSKVRKAITRRPGGRATDVVTAIHAATIALLQKQGYEQVEIPTIAERAGVNKTSVYRRWPSKAELVADVALARLRSDVPLPDTGTLQGDLSAVVRTIATAISAPLFGGLLRALISQASEAGTAKLRERFWKERFDVSGEVVRRAIARKELPATADSRLILEMAAAPIFFRSLITGEPISNAEIDVIVARVVLAFRKA